MRFFDKFGQNLAFPSALCYDSYRITANEDKGMSIRYLIAAEHGRDS